ncbi:MAG: glycoside hydrolase family 5 protein [Endomicrobium sp.]|jgi:sugar phosphate isomerase/epimerase|nr:glycoside hydrolase family 5 protein [Endomicrobium sp.]
MHKIVIIVKKYKILLVIFCLVINANWYGYFQVDNKIKFWETRRKGANIFNVHIKENDVLAAKKYNIKFIRLAVDKFPTKQRDFLIGNADNYSGLEKNDLKFLKNILDFCDKENMSVIVTMLSLPGSRWSQNNEGVDDLRLYKDAELKKQAALFWKDLARELRNYKNVVGYNILNEPHPERIFNTQDTHIDKVNQEQVQNILFEFYNLIVKSIRDVDKNTPIILDSSAYGDPNTFKYLKPLSDSNVIYSFHMYEPYEYTNYKLNKNKYSYPNCVVEGVSWNRQSLEEYMIEVHKFQTKYKIHNNKILVGEFGCFRKQKGIEKYFRDLISIFDKYEWHFAFYAFREDSWDGMDYELGSKDLQWSYWQAKESEKPYDLDIDRKSTYPQFEVLKESLIS